MRKRNEPTWIELTKLLLECGGRDARETAETLTRLKARLAKRGRS